MIIENFKDGKYVKSTLQCDTSNCDTKWVMHKSSGLYQLKKYNRHICPECTFKINSKRSSDRLKLTMSKMTKEERRINCSNAGKASQATGKPSKSWFSTERWNAKTPEEQHKQVTKANKAAYERLARIGPEGRAAHYAKIMKNGIGFISKGQQELTDTLIQLYGKDIVKSEYQIDSCCVDICLLDYRLVIEYNGDAFHCNPGTTDPEFYSTLIKMKAKDKWKLDNKRKGFLNHNKYYVLIIWESEWKKKKEEVLARIQERIEKAPEWIAIRSKSEEIKGE